MKFLKAFVNIIGLITAPLWGGLAIWILMIGELRAEGKDSSLLQWVKGEKWILQ